MNRYDATGTLSELREKLDKERAVLVRLEQALKDFVPPDTRRYRTNYDYAHFMDTNRGDIEVAISRCRDRIAYLERRIVEAARRHGRFDDDEDLVY